MEKPELAAKQSSCAGEGEEIIETPITKEFTVALNIPFTTKTLMYFEYFKSITKNDKLTLGEFLNAGIERLFNDDYGIHITFKKSEPE
jgi:hypothetical protein